MYKETKRIDFSCSFGDEGHRCLWMGAALHFVHWKVTKNFQVVPLCNCQLLLVLDLFALFDAEAEILPTAFFFSIFWNFTLSVALKLLWFRERDKRVVLIML